MGSQYQHLGCEERVTTMLRLREGGNSRAIARKLQRAPSTITREIQRHRLLPSCARWPYEATRADARAHVARFTRRRPRKLAVEGPLFDPVHSQLAQGLSPSPIAGRLRRESPGG